jgi:hypothetical protein
MASVVTLIIEKNMKNIFKKKLFPSYYPNFFAICMEAVKGLQTSDFGLRTSDFKHWFPASLIANIAFAKLANI